MSHKCDNVYTINISKYDNHDRFFSSMPDHSWSWHRRLGHANMDLISQLNTDELVKGLPKKLIFNKTKFVKLVKWENKSKTLLKTKTSFPQLDHLSYCIWIYLVPLGLQVLEKKSYAYVIVDDFSRYT